MEVVYELFEVVGILFEFLVGFCIGVYVGFMCVDYIDYLYKDVDILLIYVLIGMVRSIMLNCIFYFFDWYGFCMIIDIVCFFSLVVVY